uniref:Uncharacterized protein n=1 Tax=Chromera velia CCMP2878 TaxID=1169474 RepID=A0A0G4IBP9_9ALVE|eukprot:Cvel_12839.t1-p1 / transcript=Cvel_12839.t1 / gene=Cvel_12839 / organism=Chromera_velia_CCMP2878 / gene_product=hypothetical protein / transcript_product=hypothetical protein / location=Cvel_scaffold856:41978-48096(+) / protein_length=1375 / sequence_SO=supercontig / SO=protein_coding / is_pseudo=false
MRETLREARTLPFINSANDLLAVLKQVEEVLLDASSVPLKTLLRFRSIDRDANLKDLIRRARDAQKELGNELVSVFLALSQEQLLAIRRIEDPRVKERSCKMLTVGLSMAEAARVNESWSLLEMMVQTQGSVDLHFALRFADSTDCQRTIEAFGDAMKTSAKSLESLHRPGRMGGSFGGGSSEPHWSHSWLWKKFCKVMVRTPTDPSVLLEGGIFRCLTSWARASCALEYTWDRLESLVIQELSRALCDPPNSESTIPLEWTRAVLQSAERVAEWMAVLARDEMEYSGCSRGAEDRVFVGSRPFERFGNAQEVLRGLFSALFRCSGVSLPPLLKELRELYCRLRREFTWIFPEHRDTGDFRITPKNYHVYQNMTLLCSAASMACDALNRSLSQPVSRTDIPDPSAFVSAWGGAFLAAHTAFHSSRGEKPTQDEQVLFFVHVLPHINRQIWGGGASAWDKLKRLFTEEREADDLLDICRACQAARSEEELEPLFRFLKERRGGKAGDDRYTAGERAGEGADSTPSGKSSVTISDKELAWMLRMKSDSMRWLPDDLESIRETLFSSCKQGRFPESLLAVVELWWRFLSFRALSDGDLRMKELAVILHAFCCRLTGPIENDHLVLSLTYRLTEVLQSSSDHCFAPFAIFFSSLPRQAFVSGQWPEGLHHPGHPPFLSPVFPPLSPPETCCAVADLQSRLHTMVTVPHHLLRSSWMTLRLFQMFQVPTVHVIRPPNDNSKVEEASTQLPSRSETVTETGGLSETVREGDGKVNGEGKEQQKLHDGENGDETLKSGGERDAFTHGNAQVLSEGNVKKIGYEESLSEVVVSLLQTHVEQLCSAGEMRLLPFPLPIPPGALLYWGIGPRERGMQKLATDAVIDLLCGGLSPADLSSSNPFGQNCAKSGQIFFTVDPYVACSYIDKEFECGALVAIDGDVANAIVQNGNFRLEKEGKLALQIALMDPVPLEGVTGLVLPCAYKEDLAALFRCSDVKAAMNIPLTCFQGLSAEQRLLMWKSLRKQVRPKAVSGERNEGGDGEGQRRSSTFFEARIAFVDPAGIRQRVGENLLACSLVSEVVSKMSMCAKPYSKESLLSESVAHLVNSLFMGEVLWDYTCPSLMLGEKTRSVRKLLAYLVETQNRIHTGMEGQQPDLAVSDRQFVQRLFGARTSDRKFAVSLPVALPLLPVLIRLLDIVPYTKERSQIAEFESDFSDMAFLGVWPGEDFARKRKAEEAVARHHKGGLNEGAAERALEQVVKATERFTAVSLDREPTTFVGAWRELLAASPDGGLPPSSVWAVSWRLLWAEGAADSPCALEKLTPLRDELMESERAWRESEGASVEGGTKGSSLKGVSRMQPLESARDSAGRLVQILWDLRTYGGW